MEWDDILEIVLVSLVVVFFAVCLVYSGFKDEEHKKLHEEVGYNSIGVVQTTNKFGDPYFYRAVRYNDGCEKTIRISGAEYFEEINEEHE